MVRFHCHTQISKWYSGLIIITHEVPMAMACMDVSMMEMIQGVKEVAIMGIN
jgi:hypothetical protein